MVIPNDIKENVKEKPPRQREIIAKSYVGIKVSWKLEYKNAYEHINDGMLRIYALPEDKMYPNVFLEVEESDYPEFNILPENTSLWIEGEIKEVSSNGLNIILENVTIKFKNPSSDNSPAPNVYNNSQVHYGKGDNVGQDKTEKINIITEKASNWHEKWWGKILLALMVAIIAGGVLYYLGWV